MEMMMQHAHSAPEPPSLHTELEVPAGLDRVLLACLAKKPEERPASADALAQRLAEIETKSPWTVTRARTWWEQHHPAAGGETR